MKRTAKPRAAVIQAEAIGLEAARGILQEYRPCSAVWLEQAAMARDLELRRDRSSLRDQSDGLEFVGRKRLHRRRQIRQARPFETAEPD